MQQTNNKLILEIIGQHTPDWRRRPLPSQDEAANADPVTKFERICEKLEIEQTPTLEGSDLISVISEFSQVERTEVKSIISALSEITAIQLAFGNNFRVRINGLVSLERKPRKNSGHRITATCENELRNLIQDSSETANDA